MKMYLSLIARNIVIIMTGTEFRIFYNAESWPTLSKGSPTPKKWRTDFEISGFYPDFTEFRRFH